MYYNRVSQQVSESDFSFSLRKLLNLVVTPCIHQDIFKLTRFRWQNNRKVYSPDNHRNHQHKPNNHQLHGMPLYIRIVHLQPRNFQST